MADNVKVAVRVRPFNDREKQRNAKLVIVMEGNTTTIKDPANMGGEGRKYTFDYSYWSHDGFRERDDGYLEPEDEKYDDQARVFQDLGRGVLANAWQGFNCSLFAYGQTGSGKSYSMVGYGENKGIIPVSCEELFKGIEERKLTDDKEKEAEYQVSVSMLEIYNETVKDLLNPASFKKGGLKVREHPQKGFYVEQLKISPVRNYSDIEARIAEGNFNRTVAATNMNATSSRAHTIVSINFAQKAKNDVGKSMTKTSIINLVDLAGSERADSTGATGERLKEGSMINKSLLCLGNCIQALADKQLGKTIAIPYRDSTLTRLLKNALGGNSKTIMIAALSPADINYDETLSTLRFADRAKSIKTQAVVNESPTDKLIREMKEEIKRLQGQLKGGGGGGGVVIQGIPEDQVEEMRRQMEEELKKNQQEMEDMKLSWQQRLKEQEEGSLKMLMEERNKQEARKTTPHFWNLNEDPMLTGMVVHFVPDGKHILGNAEAANIILKGLSVEKQHATINNKANSVIKILPKGTVLVNGKAIGAETELRHNDRVMFGSAHLYVFHHPQDAAKQEKEGKNIEKVSFDSAQQEIAENKGFDMGTKGKTTEDLLLREDLLRIMPMVNEANAMSVELNKKMKFEIAILSPQARGLKDGKNEVLIRAKNLENGTEFLWDQNNFINRKYIMQEMYQNYSEGDDDWDYPQENDPFWEPGDASVMIGTALLHMQSVAYCVECEDLIPVTDMMAQEKCKIKLKAFPCDSKGAELVDEYVEDPNELLNKPFSFKVRIDQFLGIPRKYSTVWCRYKIYLSDDWNTSEMNDTVTVNPTINFEKMFNLNPATKVFIDDLQETPLVIQVWGKQKISHLDPSLAKVTTRDLVKMEPEKIKYVAQDKAQKGKATSTKDKKKDKKDAKASAPPPPPQNNSATNDALRQKDLQIEQLTAEINRLKSSAPTDPATTNNSNNAHSDDYATTQKLEMLNSMVREAKQKSNPIVLTARVDNVLKTGQDLDPNRIKDAEAQLASNVNNTNQSKMCIIV